MDERYIYCCIREKDNVLVEIMYNRNLNAYQFVNLSSAHICSCVFDSVDDAIKDMEKQKEMGKLINYYRIKY